MHYPIRGQHMRLALVDARPLALNVILAHFKSVLKIQRALWRESN